MFKKILPAFLAATIALGGYAQDKMYLIKGNEVVAKYNVADVDYVSFELPEGVTDNTGDTPSLKPISYASAVGKYFGTFDGVADYQIQLSTRGLFDENTPVEFLYLQFMGPAADYNNLSVPEGTYTAQKGEARTPFTYYKGQRDGDDIGGSLVLVRPDNNTSIAKTVESGNFTVTKEGNTYTIAGLLKLDNGEVLDFSYSGACVVDNESGEKDPAEELPLPESTLTDNVSFAVDYAFYGTHGQLFQDMPNLVYNYIWFYDSSYAECIELGFLVDKTKYEGIAIPKGKYSLVKVGSPEFSSSDKFALAAYQVQGDMNVAHYGSWCVQNYADYSPLVAGDIEVLEDYKGTGNINIRITLKDNAETPHTVTVNYNGSVDK